MTEQRNDPTHNVGADPLEADPSAGRGGSQEDSIPEQIESAEELKGSEHPVSDEERQKERGDAAPRSPGHVASREQTSGESQEGHA